ncbi:hypothetical protein ACQCN2_06030 [Brevibacillus ginsengisoli]|uniref:hypothetical protein n=1 Tax=Brevibacillus ginsengisoli TaxID=363854 RepID=UPI003CEBC669
MNIEIAKSSIEKELKIGDSVPFTERGMYIGNGTVIEIKSETYVVELDNRVTENMERYGLNR